MFNEFKATLGDSSTTIGVAGLTSIRKTELMNEYAELGYTVEVA